MNVSFHKCARTEKSFLGKPHFFPPSLFFQDAISTSSAPSNCKYFLMQECKNFCEILGVNDLEFLVFWDSVFVTYPFSIAFFGNSTLQICYAVHQRCLVADSMTTGETELGTVIRRKEVGLGQERRFFLHEYRASSQFCWVQMEVKVWVESYVLLKTALPSSGDAYFRTATPKCF